MIRIGAETTSAMALRGSGRRRAPLRGLAALAVLSLLLSGCTTVSETWNEFFGDDPVPQRVSTRGAEAQGESPPNLGAVPEAAPQTDSAAQRSALQQSLRQDRQAAEFSDRPLAPGRSAEEMSALYQNGGEAPPRVGERDPAAGTPAAPAAPAERAAPAVPAAPAPAGVQPYFQPQSLGGRPIAVIYFDYGSAALDARDRQVLSQAAAVLQQSGGRLRVIGHASLRTATTNPVQHNMANFKMSEQRAKAVADALRHEGVPASAVIVEARGASQPVYYEFMPTGEAGNRRVEIYLER